MTSRTVQETFNFWTHYREVDPDNEDTDWKTNLQVWRADEGNFQVTIVDNDAKVVAVHWIDAKTMLRFVRWLQDGPDRADA